MRSLHLEGKADIHRKFGEPFYLVKEIKKSHQIENDRLDVQHDGSDLQERRS
jgi:hypothetical protein